MSKIQAFLFGFIGTLLLLNVFLMLGCVLAQAWEKEQEFDRLRYADELELSLQMEREDERKRLIEESRWRQ